MVLKTDKWLQGVSVSYRGGQCERAKADPTQSKLARRGLEHSHNSATIGNHLEKLHINNFPSLMTINSAKNKLLQYCERARNVQYEQS